MDKNYYRDDFEELLREKADEFKLQPTRRVWKSVYNNMHPSRRWPSNAISLLLIASLLFIGYFNSNQSNQDQIKPLSKLSPTANQNAIVADLRTTSNSSSSVNSLDNRSNAKNKLVANNNTTDLQIAENRTPNTTQSQKNNNKNNIGNNSITKFVSTLTAKSISNNEKADTKKAITNASKLVSTNKGAIIPSNSNEAQSSTNAIENVEISSNSSVEPTINSSANSSTAIENQLAATEVQSIQSPSAANLTTINASLTNNEDKAWIENFVFYNKGKTKKWKEKMAYELYVTPGISYRTLNSNIKYNNNPSAGFVMNTEPTAINQKPEFSAEMGASMIYSFAKKLRLKFGGQFNYNSYAINAYETNHPVLTTLTLNDLNSGYPYLISRNTLISNIAGIGAATFHNKSFQVSLPIGLEYKLAGNNKLQWYGAATIQPTFVVAAKAYLLSSDRKNYVADNSMVRNWSLNTGFETFISYQTKAGVSLQVGPQFRYQIPSTYGKKYSLDEKLFSAGMKIGIVRNF